VEGGGDSVKERGEGGGREGNRERDRESEGEREEERDGRSVRATKPPTKLGG